MPVSPGSLSCTRARTHTHTRTQKGQTEATVSAGINLHLSLLFSNSVRLQAFLSCLLFSKRKHSLTKIWNSSACNPKWSTDSFPLDLFHLLPLSFLMDNDWKHSPVGIPTALSETDV